MSKEGAAVEPVIRTRHWGRDLSAKAQALRPSRAPGISAFRTVTWLAIGLLILVATLAMWPASDLPRTAPGLAESWRAALHEAARLGLGFGNDIVFTYGPLGYLAVPRFFDEQTGTMAIAATVLMSACFVATSTVVMHARKVLAVTVVGVLVASRLASVLDPMLFPVLTVLAWASFVAYRGFPFPMTTLVIIAGSALGAVALLMKFNAGITILAMVAGIVIATAPRRPWLVAVALVATVVPLGGAWLSVGMDIDALPEFLIGSVDLASGYSAAMALPIPTWQVFAAVLVAGMLLLRAYRSSRHVDRVARFGLLISIATVSFFAWKHGVIRHGLDGYFAEAVLIGLLASDWRRGDLRLAGITLGVPFAFFLLASPNPSALLQAGRSIETAAGRIAAAVLPGAAHESALQVEGRLRSAYALPPGILAEVSGRTTHIEGWETAVAVAYPEIHWRPAPIFQSYAVFTRSADERNAAFLRDEGGPDRILRQRPRAIDQRYWLFDGPETTLAMFCRYQETAVSMGWQVLARSTDRCGPERVISTVRALSGETVEVPALDAPSMFLAVRITGVGAGVAQSVTSALYRGSTWEIRLDDRQHRLVPGTASGPLLLATNASLGYRQGWALSRTIRQVSVEEVGGGSPSDLTFTFVAIPVAP